MSHMMSLLLKCPEKQYNSLLNFSGKYVYLHQMMRKRQLKLIRRSYSTKLSSQRKTGTIAGQRISSKETWWLYTMCELFLCSFVCRVWGAKEFGNFCIVFKWTENIIGGWYPRELSGCKPCYTLSYRQSRSALCTKLYINQIIFVLIRLISRVFACLIFHSSLCSVT